MTSEPGHDPNRWESAPRPTTQSTPVAKPVHYNSARHGTHVEESPELLRWRADLLMDEMMMGGVDVSAADGNRTFSGVDAPVVSRSQPANGGPKQGAANGMMQQETHGDRGREQSALRPNGTPNGASSDPSRDSANGSTGYGSTYGANGSLEDESNGHYRPVENRPSDVGRPSAINGGYPSPTSSDTASRPMAPRPYDEPRREDAQYDEPRASQQGQTPAGSAPANYASAYETRPQEYQYRQDLPLDAGVTRPRYEDEGNERGISAPRRYPVSRPDVTNVVNNTANGDPLSGGRDGQGNRPVQDGAQLPADRPYENRADVPELPPSYPPTLRTTADGKVARGGIVSDGNGTDSNLPDEAPARTDRLYSVEQQYEQFRREQSANVQPVEPVQPAPRVATRPPLPPVEPARQPSAPPRVTPQPVDQHTEWATGQDKWEYQDFSANPDAPEDEEPLHSSYAAPERRHAPESAVRHDPAQFVSAMSVMGSGKKRSTLLPRSTELDIDTLHREISDLHGEIAMLLPVGNETSERARHLLDKAYSILQSDPSRSAEVEYYMQQVRSIVQRLYQSRKWSDLYRQRLHVYLLGWLGLSAMVLFGRFVFQIDLEDALMWLFGLPLDSWVVAHWATFVGTAAAGSFGGAVGALYTMQNHARGEHSFFDRKYGLRGLILPFMGLIVGAVGYVIFGLIFALVGINPSQSLTAAIVPTVAALAFGFSQESIYGTRN